jgi:phosphoribosylanthranilate isomerase
VFVKICGITNESDALLAVAMGADAIGFVFAPSPRQIAPQIARDIARRLPPEIITVGVFRDESAQRVVEVVNTMGLRGAQLHGRESPAEARWVSQRVPFTIKAFSAGDRLIDKVAEYPVGAIMLDAAEPGSGQVFDWSLAAAVPVGTRVILAGGLDPDNVDAAIERVQPWGVDVSSGVEASPGRKDAMKVRYFINNAKAHQRSDDYEDYSELGVDDLAALAEELADEPDVFDWEEDVAIDLPVEDDDIASEPEPPTEPYLDEGPGAPGRDDER